MKKLPFKKSKTGSIGVELELQLIDPNTSYLISRSKDFIRSLKAEPYEAIIKPEITQSMIEINSSIHQSTTTLREELASIHSFLLHLAEKLGVSICGGGTHPYVRWMRQKIFPTPRYKRISSKFRYLSKRSTVFGQHIHFGCPNSEEALYLTHALGRYVPHFIALSASSPFYQGIDTGYASSRSNVFSSFPQSGHIPFLLNWTEFSEYYYFMRKMGIIVSMKDFYWDVRPKPEYGTVEIRVFDTPLSMCTAINLAAYVQSLAFYLLKEKPLTIDKNLYYLYTHNRFHASRYGLNGQFIDPSTLKETLLAEDILKTIELIAPYTKHFGSETEIEQIKKRVHDRMSDTDLLRQSFKRLGRLPKVVEEQCRIWSQPLFSDGEP
ncbi:YbdK family carboxylate-amine ligase [Legionella jordanis]|uniref:Putative glutamate--cysteine ligase 2 n=1 Tax=Legionella jordanis TaxID=456 RepID=A0A0W0VG70_9GAMM|nr:YbdK family carboxylate-amine ligase [Legionella jordanis]KTD19035.1 carboxylate-amine ligase [Legionella jordanis]RMX05406.1 glutamate--cysteine ligase [Legionella jordanis]RMX19089.1 glutamate--cysteine ligase [Legionella jordanis]VEH13138.1 carboxylate-amine ligase [Legionella jordanis]HAT8714797.1 glutamate--cysteine ligase [Legionella jordanis]